MWVSEAIGKIYNWGNVALAENRMSLRLSAGSLVTTMTTQSLLQRKHTNKQTNKQRTRMQHSPPEGNISL
jgi:hypothetical protein